MINPLTFMVFIDVIDLKSCFLSLKNMFVSLAHFHSRSSWNAIFCWILQWVFELTFRRIIITINGMLGVSKCKDMLLVTLQATLKYLLQNTIILVVLMKEDNKQKNVYSMCTLDSMALSLDREWNFFTHYICAELSQFWDSLS